MKRLFGILAVLIALAIAAPAAACWGPGCNTDAVGNSGQYVSHGTNGPNGGYAESYSDGSYSAKGNHFAVGETGSNGKVGAIGDSAFGGRVGYSAAGAHADSFAKTRSNYCRKGWDRTEVNGGVFQSNGAGAYDANNKGEAWASGGNSSGADYHAVDYGLNRSGVRGGADTLGGTLTGAYTTHKPGTTTSVAGGITGNFASAYRGCDSGHVSVYGEGRMDTGTYASTRRGEAWTNSTSGFTYNGSGSHCAFGAGAAYGLGYSNVTNTPHGATGTAYTTSGAFSTGGNGQVD